MTYGEGVPPVAGSSSRRKRSNGDGNGAANPDTTDVSAVSDAPTPAPDATAGFVPSRWDAAPGTARRGWETPWARPRNGRAPQPGNGIDGHEPHPGGGPGHDGAGYQADPGRAPGNGGGYEADRGRAPGNGGGDEGDLRRGPGNGSGYEARLGRAPGNGGGYEGDLRRGPGNGGGYEADPGRAPGNGGGWRDRASAITNVTATTLTARTATPPLLAAPVSFAAPPAPPAAAPLAPAPPVPTLPTTTTLVRPRTAEPPLPPTTARVERPTPSGKLPYNPALDGIRGLAVAAVLLFHGEVTWARGGFLGVSTFFTLSGFLITTLLVREHQGTGRIGLTAFWARRLRRLLPASALTLVLVSVSAFLTAEVWERSLRADVIASALNVANWRFLLADASYAERFASPSPVLHFWSLAIEEQFYWLFPLLAAGVLAVARGSLRVFAGVLTALLGVAAGLTLLLGGNPDTVYYATPIRMGEILVGALLAVVVARGAIVESRRLAPVVAAGGVLALGATFWAWWKLEEATPVLYDGGLLLYAGVSGLLVVAACVPGPMRWLLAREPLRLLGVVSYGVYLFHWPIFLLLSEERVDGWLSPLDLHPRGLVLLVIRLVPTLLLAALSYRWLERPIRRGQRPKKAPAPWLAGGAVASVVLVAGVVPWVSPPPPDPFARFMEAIDGPDPDSLAPDARIGVTLGDSTMLMTAWGLSVWGMENGRLVVPGGSAGVGCGIGRGGSVRYGDGRGELDDGCERWAETLVSEVDEARDRYGHVDFAVVQTGPWDVADRKLEGDDQWRHIGDPVYDRYLRQEFETANDLLLEQGLVVVWLTSPTIEAGRNENPPPEDPYPESDPERMRRLNGLITSIAAERQGVVVVDLADFIDRQPDPEDDRLRPDGVHFTEETSTEVATAWLGEELLAAIDRETVPTREEESEPATETTSQPQPQPPT